MADALQRARVAAWPGVAATGREAPAVPPFDAAGGTVRARIAELALRLAERGMADAEREARELVAAVLDVSRLWPVLRGDAELAPEVWASARAAAARRAAGAPLAYAVGWAAFRHLTLAVDERVLIPRPETEQLVERVLERMEHSGGSAVDIGTGSGAIALALACEGRFERVVATDVSLGALAVARANVARLAPALRAPVELRAGAGVAPVRGERARVVVSNPPYIAAAEVGALPRSVRDWEPPVALLGGGDGMRMTAALVRDAARVLEPGGLLALEVDARRASCAASLARESGHYTEVRICPDLAGRDRILLATRTDG